MCMKPFVHPAVDDITLSGILTALADPVRLAIVRKLDSSTQGLNCTAGTPCPALPKSTLSNHFRILRECGLIRTEKRGLEHINHVRRADIAQKFPGLLDLILTLSQQEM